MAKENSKPNFESVLQKIDETMPPNFDLSEILRKICETVVETFKVDHSGVVLFDPELVQGTVEAEYPIWNLKGAVIPLRGVKDEEELIRTKNTLMIVDIPKQESLGPVRHILLANNIKTMLIVPIVVKDRPLGSFSLDISDGPRTLTVQEIEFCKSLASWMAIAIQHSRLLEQVQKELRIVNGFYEVSSEMYPTFNPDDVLKNISDNVKETLGALSVSLTALDSSGRPYEKAQAGYEDKVRVVRPKGLSTIVMETGTTCIIPDVAKTKVSINPGMIRDGVKAAICLPLQAIGRNAGVMWVTYDKPRQFFESEVKLLRLLANQAGSFIETSRLFRERQLLLEISKMVASAEDLDQSLQTLAEMMVKSLSATFCRISILDDVGKTLTTRAAYSIVESLSWNPPVGLHYSLVDATDEAKAINTGEIQVLNVDENRDLLVSLGKRANFRGFLRAAVLIPLSIGETAFGVITLGERRGWERGSFTLERIGLCQSMANQVAALIARMRLQEQAERDSVNFRRLYEAGSNINNTLDPDQALHFIVEKACQAVEGWRAAAILLDENNTPHRAAAVGFDKGLDELIATIRPNGISMEVIKTGIPAIFEDIQATPDVINPAMLKAGVQAAVCLPLRLAERNIGVLWIHYKEPQRFLPLQVDALKLYAAQAAIAYDNARKIRELEHMHQAAQAIAGVLELPQILRQIVESAAEVLQGDSSAIWSYDNVGNEFIPEEFAAYGIPKTQLEKFRKKTPKKGGTAETVMGTGWVGVEDISDPKYDFMGSSTLHLLENIGVKSFQGISLSVGDEKLGALYVNYKRFRSFRDEDKKTLETVAYHAALALKKARLLRELDIAHGAAALIAEATVANDLDKTLQFIVKETATVLGADAVMLYPYEAELNQLGHPPVMVGVLNEEPIRRFKEARKGTAVWKILELDKIYVAEEAPTDSVTKGRFVEDEKIKSSVGIPLKVKGVVVGVMFINYRSTHHIKGNELTNIGLFANQAAVAIRNAQLHTALQKRAEALEGLYKAGSAITSTLTMSATLNRIAEEALKMVGVGREQAACFSHIALVEGDKLSFAATFPSGMLALMKASPDIDLTTNAKLGITGYVARNGQSQNIEDVSLDPNYLPISEHTRSQLSVPIFMSNQVIGVLSVSHPNRNAFTIEGVHNLEMLAAQAAIAIQNARHYQELERTKGTLAARSSVAWIGMASSAWRHTIERHAVTIRDQVQLMRSDSEFVASSAKITKRLEMIDRLAKQIIEKPITPPLTSEEGVLSISINGLIRERVKQLWREPPYELVDIDLSLTLDDEINVRVSPEWVRRVLDILIDNAVDAATEQNNPEISIITQKNGHRIEVSVSDNGSGISPAVLESMFHSQIKSSKGLGMGLLFADMIIQTYQGKIFCKTTGLDGTTMAISLPIDGDPFI